MGGSGLGRKFEVPNSNIALPRKIISGKAFMVYVRWLSI
jgi:hypothetical protein